MKEMVITQVQAGQRLDRFLQRTLREASGGFLYKMLRKKNITLNGRKAAGTEKLAEGDVIRLYFADETLRKFMGEASDAGNAVNSAAAAAAGIQEKGGGQTASLLRRYPEKHLDILYEDDNVLLVNKPAGMLSQKSRPSDVSLNEFAVGYLLRSGAISEKDFLTVRPSVCNRLDRNTSGIVAVGKTIAGLQELSRIFRDRSAGKYYLALVRGALQEPEQISGYLVKDEKDNQVKIFEKEPEGAESAYIRTDLEPLRQVPVGEGPQILIMTLLMVHLITGKSHQIRAHLQAQGHPIAGDPKYGDPRINAFLRDRFQVRRQLLHCAELDFPKMAPPLDSLSGMAVRAPLPADFRRVLGE